MKEYKIIGNYVNITLDNGKVVKCDKKWVDKSIQALNTDIEDVLLMFLEDNGYLINEEQEQLNKQAKGKVKNVVSTEKPKKTPKERVQKENPTKELIIATIANTLQSINATNIVIENKNKIITFTLNDNEFKIDLTQKRQPKSV